jgi:hypothetical protein
MSKTLKRMEKFLTEQPDLERFDTSKQAIKDIAGLGKDLITFSKKAKKMDGSEALSRLNDYYDELWEIKEDLESYLSGG